MDNPQHLETSHPGFLGHCSQSRWPPAAPQPTKHVPTTGPLHLLLFSLNHPSPKCPHDFLPHSLQASPDLPSHSSRFQHTFHVIPLSMWVPLPTPAPADEL